MRYKDGFREKSHYAVFVYITERYAAFLNKKFLTEFNVMRLNRHEILYGLDEMHLMKDDLQNLMILCKAYVDSVKKLIK